MASPTHRDNILSQTTRSIGVAVVEGVLLEKQTILVVQMFGNLTTSVQECSTTSTDNTNSISKVVTGNRGL